MHGHVLKVCFFLVSIQIREVWNAYELDLVNYQNKCRLIRGWDDLFNKVKEHINSVSAMKLSPYYKVPVGTPSLTREPLTSLQCLLTVSYQMPGKYTSRLPLNLHSLASFCISMKSSAVGLCLPSTL